MKKDTNHLAGDMAALCLYRPGPLGRWLMRVSPRYRRFMHWLHPHLADPLWLPDSI